ncbi:hypothetical protein [Neokomagataea thailandica]|nr:MULTISPECIES: hypothetical protein [Neokomagataea]
MTDNTKYNEVQMDTLESDIQKINTDYYNCSSFQNVQSDVAKFYSDQINYHLSGYPTTAREVALDQGLNGYTANLNMQSGIKDKNNLYSITEKMMVRLAQSDYDTINFNGGVPASIAQITDFHVKVYHELSIDNTYWSGFSSANKNLNWIPDATALDLRDVQKQSQYTGNPSSTQIISSLNNLMAAGIEGVGDDLLHFNSKNENVSQFKDKLLHDSKILLQNIESYPIQSIVDDLETGLELSVPGTQEYLIISKVYDVTTLSLARNGNVSNICFDKNGNLLRASTDINNQATSYIIGGDQSETAQHANEIILSNDYLNINGNNNTIIDINQGNSFGVNGSGNNITADKNTLAFINGRNDNFSGSSGDTVGIGNNSDTTIYGTGENIHLNGTSSSANVQSGGNSIYDWNNNNTINSNSNLIFEAQKGQSIHINGNDNYVNSIDNSTTFIGGFNNTITGYVNSVVGLNANSSLNVKGHVNLYYNGDNSSVNAESANNYFQVWAHNDVLSGNPNQTVSQPLGNTNFHNAAPEPQPAPQPAPSPLPPPNLPNPDIIYGNQNGVFSDGNGGLSNSSNIGSDPSIPGTGFSYSIGSDDDGDDPIIVSVSGGKVSTIDSTQSNIIYGSNEVGWFPNNEGMIFEYSHNTLKPIDTFNELKSMDTNNDGIVNSKDTSWKNMYLLTGGENKSLKFISINQSNIEDICTHITPSFSENNNNIILATSDTTLKNGGVGQAAQVVFSERKISMNPNEWVQSISPKSLLQDFTKKDTFTTNDKYAVHDNQKIRDGYVNNVLTNIDQKPSGVIYNDKKI